MQNAKLKMQNWKCRYLWRYCWLSKNYIVILKDVKFSSCGGVAVEDWRGGGRFVVPVRNSNAKLPVCVFAQAEKCRMQNKASKGSDSFFSFFLSQKKPFSKHGFQSSNIFAFREWLVAIAPMQNAECKIRLPKEATLFSFFWSQKKPFSKHGFQSSNIFCV